MRAIDFDVMKAKELYVDHKHSIREVGELLGVNFQTIRRRLIANGIAMRSQSETVIEQYKRGKVHPRKGNGCLRPDGYLVTGSYGQQKRIHVLIAEKAIGKKLPEFAVVHHVNGKKPDNRNENLVICKDQKYHSLLHRRQKALESCGNAGYMKCRYCKEWDDPKNMYQHPDGRHAEHLGCRAKYIARKNSV